MRAFIISVIVITIAAVMAADDCHHDWAKWPGHPNNGGYYTCQTCGMTRAIHW